MYVMCLFRAIDAIASEQMSSATSVQLLDQHFDGSADDLNAPTTSEYTPKSNTDHLSRPSASVVDESSKRSAQIENITDLDEVSLAKSIEDLNSLAEASVKRSSTFTITKNESISLFGASATDDLPPGSDSVASGSNNFQSFIETHSRPVSTVEIGGYQTAIEIVLSLLLEAEEALSRKMPDVKDLCEAKAQFQAHEEFMMKLAEYQEYVGGALEEGARLLSEPIENTGLTVEDQSEIKQQMLLLNERWELLRVSALDVQSRIHSKLAQIQMQKIEDLRILLTNTEDQISQMPEIDSNPDAIQAQITEHKSLEASLNEQKSLVDDLSNLVVIVNDESFNDLEDKLSALGERWTHVVQWTKTRFEKLQMAHLHWKLLNRRLSIAGEWMNVRENDLKRMETQDIGAIGRVMERMQHLRFCAMDLNALNSNILHLEEIAEELQPGSQQMLEHLENLQDRCDALKEIVDVQQQRIEGMGFDFNVDILDNVKLPNGWKDFQAKLSADNCLSMDGSDLEESSNDESPQSHKKRRLQRSGKLQQLDALIQGMIDFVCASEQGLSELNTLSTCKEQRKTLETLQTKLQEKITEYEEVKKHLNECIEGSKTDLTEEANEISNLGCKYDEINVRIEQSMAINDQDGVKERFLRNLTGLKLVLADCQDWFKQHGNMNASTQNELENRLDYMDSLSGEINECQEYYNNANDETPLHEWKIDYDQFIQSWMDIKNAIKRLLNDTLDEEQSDANSEMSEDLKVIEELCQSIEQAAVVYADLEEMNDNLKHISDLKTFLSDIKGEKMQSQQWQKLASTIEERFAKQVTAIDNVKNFTTEYNAVTGFLTNLEQIFSDEIFILGEEDDLKKQLETYDANGMELKKVEIDITSVKNFSEIITRESSDDQYNSQLLEKIEILNELYGSVKKTYQTNSKALKQAIEQTQSMFKRINDTENWLNELETSTPSIRNVEIKTSNELFQIRNKFQSLKEMCEKRTVEFRELNESGSEIILRIDEQLNQPNCQRKFSTLAKYFTKLNARWTDVTALVYNRTALLEHISIQLGELKTLIVSETGYLDKLEKCLRKSPENAADAEEIYEELDVSYGFHQFISIIFNETTISIFFFYFANKGFGE